MTSTLALILILCVFLLLSAKKNIYILAYISSFLGFGLVIFVLLNLYAKYIVYGYLNAPNIALYHMFANYKLTYFQLITLLNIGISIFLFALQCFSCGYKDKAKNYRSIIFSALLLILYTIVNSPRVLEYIYIFSFSETFYTGIARQAVIILNSVILTYFFLYPHITFCKNYILTKIFIKQKRFVITEATIIVLQLLFIAFILMTPIRKFLYNFSLYNSFGSITYNNYYSLTNVLSIVVLIAMYTITVIIYAYGIIFLPAFVKKMMFFKQEKVYIMNLQNTFHTYKNIMMQLAILNKKTYECDDIQSARNFMARTDSIIQETLKYSANCTKLYVNNLGKNLNNTNIQSCIYSAIDKADIDCSKINLTVNLFDNSYDELLVFANPYLITEVFYNIIVNAKEALLANNPNSGIIDISIWRENCIVCISIKNNGGNINKTQAKKIFDPFFSTKNNNINCGIGLAHSKKIVDGYFGTITLHNHINEFVEFQVTFPLSKHKSERNFLNG